MRALKNQPNVILTDPDYPDGRIRNNDGTGNGTGVNEAVYGDLHSNISKLMRLYAITPNSFPDNETSGFQIIEALRGLASKNDFIYPLITNGTVLSVDIKFSQMLVNEFIVCLAQFNKGSETQIKGENASLFNINYSGNFKTNEYVRVVKTSGGVSIIRLADALSLDAMVADFAYLKKANQTQENAGTIDTVATTPLTNLVAFTRRVIGVDSGDYLAIATGVGARNGLLSSADKTIIDNFNKVKNIGWFSGYDITSVGVLPSVGGNVVSAIATNDAGVAPDGCVVVNFENAMNNLNYFVRIHVQSEGVLGLDNDLICPVFKIITTTQIRIAFKESSPGTQSLKIHIEAIQL